MGTLSMVGAATDLCADDERVSRNAEQNTRSALRNPFTFTVLTPNIAQSRNSAQPMCPEFLVSILLATKGGS